MPPVMPLADVGVLAPQCDGVLLVVRAGVTPKPLIERALGTFDAARLLGIVLNESGRRRARRYGYSYEAASTARPTAVPRGGGNETRRCRSSTATSRPGA